MTRNKILLIIGILFVLIQFIRIDKINPSFEVSQDFINMMTPDPNISETLKGACYDCHSNQTIYPWYSNVAPISFMLRSHIKGGRQHLNYSEWGVYNERERLNKIDEMIEVLEDKRMPMKSYTWLHPNGKVKGEKTNALIEWLKTKIEENEK